MKGLHVKNQLNIEESNSKFKAYADKRRLQIVKEADMVIYLWKEPFPNGTYSKLS